MANEAETVLDMTQLQGILAAGGPVMIVLLAMSIIGLTIVLLKAWQFFRVRLGDYRSITTAVQQWRLGDANAAVESLKASRNPAARVVETAIQLKRQPDVDDALAREEVVRVASNQLSALRTFLRPLDVIGTLSPLLGLLGTVLGMIKAFQRLEGAGTAVDPSILSGGIWEALLTTAAGLIIAIPAVMALHWLERRVDRFKLAMEDAVTQVFTSPLTRLPDAAGEFREIASVPDRHSHRVPAAKSNRADGGTRAADSVLVPN